MTPAYVDRALDEYIGQLPLDPAIRALIADAVFDLNNGPAGTSPDYPGFESAVDRIREAFEDLPDEVYYEHWSGEIVETMPADGDSRDYLSVPVETLKRSLAGSLAEYL